MHRNYHDGFSPALEAVSRRHCERPRMHKGLVIGGLWLVVACVLAVGIMRLRPGVDVILVNESDGSFKGAVLTFTGGTRDLHELRAGSVKRVRIAVTGESDLVVKCTDATSQTRLHKLNVYIEPGYRGRIVVTFRKSGEVTCDASLLNCAPLF